MQAVTVGSWAYQTTFEIVGGNEAGIFDVSQQQHTGNTPPAS